MLGHIADLLVSRRVLPCVGPKLATASLRGVVERIAGELKDPERAHVMAAIPRVSEAFARLAQRMGPGRLRQRIRPWVDDAHAPTPAALDALVKLSPALNYVLTTNLDRALDRAFAGNWPSVAPSELTPGQAGVLVSSCGDLREAPGITRDELFGVAGAARRGALEWLLRGHYVLLLGYLPDDEALRYLHEACGGALRGCALVPADAASVRGYFPEAVELVPVSGPFDAGAARVLAELAELYRDRTRLTLPASGDDVPLTHRVERPFPGLVPYTAANHRFFFGREIEVDRLVARIGESPRSCWCHVEGPSGVGKSSFLRAGLAPRLEAGDPAGGSQRWLVAAVRPGYDPLRSLATALRDLFQERLTWSPDALATHIARDPALLGKVLDESLEVDEALLLLVDPLDEALTLCSPEQAAGFARALAFALARGARKVALVTSLRSDLADLMPRLPRLTERGIGLESDFRRITLSLAPLSRDQLQAALVRAARRGGLEFEAGLVQRLLDDAEPDRLSSESIHVLPNLAAALDRLWAGREGSNRLTHAAYHGVESALTAAADSVVEPWLAEHEHVVRALFLALVRVDEGRRVGRRQLVRADLVARLVRTSTRLEVIEELLAAVSGADPRRGAASLRLVSMTSDRVELVHDALLRGWLRLVRWIDSDHEDLLRTEMLCQAARRWDFFGRSEDPVLHPSEVHYLRLAEPIDELGREFKAAFEASLKAAGERERELSDVLAHLRERVLSPRRGEPPPVGPLVAEVDAKVARVCDLRERSPHSGSSLLLWEIKRALDRGREELERRGAQEAQSLFREAHGRAERAFRRAPADPEVERVLASALTALGDVELQLGLVQDACHHLHRAGRIFRDLRAGGRFPADPGLLAEQIGVLLLLAEAELGRGALPDATLLLAEALAEVVAAEAPPPRELQAEAAARRPRVAQRLAAQVWTRLAHLAMRRGDDVAARAHLAEANLRAPRASFVLDALATLEQRPGGDLAAARTHLVASVELAREALRRESGRLVRGGEVALVKRAGLSACRELTLRLCRLGELKVRLADHEGAGADLAEAYALAAAIHEIDPCLRAKRDLSRCLDRLGRAASARGDLDAAQQHFGAALQHDLDSVAVDPRSQRARFALATAYLRCGEVHLHRDPAAARPFFLKAEEQCTLCRAEPQAGRLEAKLRRHLTP